VLAVERSGKPLLPRNTTNVVLMFEESPVVSLGYAIADSRGSIAVGRGTVAIARRCVASGGIVLVARLTRDLAADVPLRKPRTSRLFGCPFSVGPRGERYAFVDPVEPFFACGHAGMSLTEGNLRSLLCLYAHGGCVDTTQATLFRSAASKPQNGTRTLRTLAARIANCSHGAHPRCPSGVAREEEGKNPVRYVVIKLSRVSEGHDRAALDVETNSPAYPTYPAGSRSLASGDSL
jgi:hypothetical protein